MKIKPKTKRHGVWLYDDIHQEYVVILNIYAPSIGKSKYAKQIFIYMKGETNCNAVKMGMYIPHFDQ